MEDELRGRLPCGGRAPQRLTLSLFIPRCGRLSKHLVPLPIVMGIFRFMRLAPLFKGMGRNSLLSFPRLRKNLVLRRVIIAILGFPYLANEMASPSRPSAGNLKSDPPPLS